MSGRTEALQLLSDLLPFSAAVGRLFGEPALGGHAFDGLHQGGGAVLEGLVGVQKGSLDQLLDCLRLCALKVGLEFGQLLVLRVQGYLKLDVLQDGCLGLDELLQRVFFFRENVEFPHSDWIHFVELGGSQEQRPGYELIVLVGEDKSFEEELVEQSEGDEERASAELEVPLGAVEPVDALDSKGVAGDGLALAAGLAGRLWQGVLVAWRNVPDVLDERCPDCLHFLFLIIDLFFRISIQKHSQNSMEF